MWVVYGILRVLLTALFHWILSWHTCLLFMSHVWDPYQEQQYVCKRLPLTRLDTLRNFTFSLLTCDIKMPVFKVTSAESRRSCVKMFPRCLTLSFQTRAVPCKVTLTLGSLKLLPIFIHMVLLALNKTLYSIAKLSEIYNSSWRARTGGAMITTSSA